MSYYKRNLPHWQPPKAKYFVTFRLAGSLPKKAVSRIKSLQKKLDQEEKTNTSTEIRRKIFQKYEDLLEKNVNGPYWLKKPAIASIVSDAIQYRDGKQCDLYAFCIMPNHVHLIFKLLKSKEKAEYPVTKILASLKRFTAREANKLLNRKGQFWQHESFDRVIRDNNELKSTIKYVLNNPVKANLVEEWTNWPYSFCKSEIRNELT